MRVASAGTFVAAAPAPRVASAPLGGAAGKLKILVSLLNPKFAKVPAEQSCELRVLDTRNLVPQRFGHLRYPMLA